MNHRKTKVFCGDLTGLDKADVMKSLGLMAGELDLLAGCPPCQGFSTHKTRNRPSSAHDERNDLIFSVLDYIKFFLPKAVMIENVPGLAKDYRIQEFKSQLALLGYQINDETVKVLDAADYGVPQRRKRMILQASRFGFLREAPKAKRRISVGEVFGKLKPVGLSGDMLHDLPVKRSDKVNKIIANVPKNGGSRSDLPLELWLPCHKRRPGSYKDVYGRMSWEEVAPTITGGCTNPSKGRFIHPFQDRAITLREAALLQSFPSGYKFSLSKGKDFVALMIGNALPPEFIKVHAKQFFAHLKQL